MERRDRTIRFGTMLEPKMSSRASIRDFARRAEDLGYSHIAVGDHFGESIAPLIALMTAGEATSSLRLATLVLDNDFRHPVVLAKEAASVDVMTGGRLEIGMGAGWLQGEYQQAGIEFSRPGERIARLGEAVEVITGLFGDGPFSYAGRYYSIDGLDGSPKPAQRPRPPIQIGGASPVILKLAGRLADAVNLVPRTDATGAVEAIDFVAENLDEKLSWVREGAGARFGDLEFSAWMYGVICTDRPVAAAEELLRSWAAGKDPAWTFNVPPTLTARDLVESPFFAIGTPDSMADHFSEMRERFGITSFQVPPADIDALSVVLNQLSDA